MVSQDGPVWVYCSWSSKNANAKSKSTLQMNKNENVRITSEKRIRIVFHVLSWIRMVYFTQWNERDDEWLYEPHVCWIESWELNSFYRFRFKQTKQRFEVVAVTGDDGERRQRINGLRRFIEHTLTLPRLQTNKIINLSKIQFSVFFFIPRI